MTMQRLFVATRKGLFILERGKSGSAPWTITGAYFLGDSVSMCLFDRRDNHAYAAIGHGHFGVKMHRSADGGTTWAECKAPAYPPLPEGREPDKCPMRGINIPWNLELVWSLEAGGPKEDGLLWCGTVPGGLFRSRDRGDSWELIESLWNVPERKAWFGGGLDYPGIDSICVDPRNPRRVAVAISCGGVWITDNGGDAWVCRADGMRAEYMPPDQQGAPHIQDPHRMVQCPAEPDKMWVQHHNGIFRTTDGAKSWHEVTTARPSGFGFAVAVHPKNGDRAWFVPAIKDEKRIPVDAKVVVSRTSDGGKTFDILTKGLPQSHAYDITFRHCLDVDDSGDRLAFGSTTGSLWSSDDGGDSWQTISNNLPPAYCVRFA